MRITLTELKPQLEASARETAQTMRQIEKEDASVKQATIMVKRDENMANVQSEIAKDLKTECEADLAKALPALDEAIGLFPYFNHLLYMYFLIFESFLPRFENYSRTRYIEASRYRRSEDYEKSSRSDKTRYGSDLCDDGHTADKNRGQDPRLLDT